MKAKDYESHHPRRLIRGLGVILLAAAAGAAVAIAWMHSSIKGANVELALNKMQAPLAKPGNRRAQTSTAATSGDARVRVKCAECGVDVSTGRTGQLGGGLYPGAVVGLASAAVTPGRVRGEVGTHALRIRECRGGYLY